MILGLSLIDDGPYLFVNPESTLTGESLQPIIPLTKQIIVGIMGITSVGGVAYGTRRINEPNSRTGTRNCDFA